MLEVSAKDVPAAGDAHVNAITIVVVMILWTMASEFAEAAPRINLAKLKDGWCVFNA